VQGWGSAPYAQGFGLDRTRASVRLAVTPSTLAPSVAGRCRSREIAGRRVSRPSPPEFAELGVQRMSDAYDLQRFVDAQNPVFDQVSAELRAGRKRSHWMWFVFPQIRGLGASPMARRYAIDSQGEAEAYLDHPILGPRLRECTRLVTAIEGRTIEDIFGHPDDRKFRSSMTLFAHATPDNKIFTDAIAKYFPAGFDPLTLQRL
jgi:uncharacterized protein (DUF1810 family)